MARFWTYDNSLSFTLLIKEVNYSSFVSSSEKIPDDKNVLSLSLICASSYSDKRGIGSCLMNFLKKICEKSDFTDIILEVANEHASSYESDDEEEAVAEAVAETNLSYTLSLAEIDTVTGFLVYVTCPVKVIWLLKFTCVSVTSVAVNA